MAAIIADSTRIKLIEDEVVSLDMSGKRLSGVTTRLGAILYAPATIVTTGTFMNGLCHVGDEQFSGGRVGERHTSLMSTSLLKLGIELGRFKTGTTPRLLRDSIDWTRLQEQPGDVPRPRFSVDKVDNFLPQMPCHHAYTNEKTHQLIRESLHRSPLFTGVIDGTGPRYCPSIEDKVVRFADKRQHTLFLEPEGLSSDWIYPNGLSTSLPRDVQEALLQTIEGLEKVVVAQHGYAVEYDYAPPTQLHASLMSKKVPGLFLAGQINGTSGYEEAGGQGLVAGLNAMRYAGNLEPVILGRHQAYIGVMIDDLVTQGVDEPYRMFTSRAEHRLTLRESTAEVRLTPLGHKLGLVGDTRAKAADKRATEAERLREYLSQTSITAPRAVALGIEPESVSGMSLEALLRRPEIRLETLLADASSYSDAALRVSEEHIKYAGYIAREARQIAKLNESDDYVLPDSISYSSISGFSTEIAEKLHTVRPRTLGQASRIPGMTPAAIALLRVHAFRSVSRETSS